MNNENLDQEEKVSLKFVGAELAPEAQTLYRELRQICTHQSHGKPLILKSDLVFEGPVQLVSEGFDVHLSYYEVDGEVQEDVTELSAGKTIFLKGDGKPLILGPAHVTGTVEAPRLTISKFTFDGEAYYPLDETGMFPASLDFERLQIYVDKSHFEDYLKDGAVQLPPYADENHTFHSPELVLAIDAHQAIMVGGYEKKAYPKHSERVDAWFKEFHPKASKSTIDRIRGIIGDEKYKEKGRKSKPPANKSS